MTFRFERIGPVDNAEITLGDLTIIAGRNNTGKTYLVYALYGFLKQWEAWPRAGIFFRHHARDPTHPVTALKLPKIAKALAELDRASVQVTPAVLAEVRRRLVDQLARDFSAGALPAVFSTTSEALGDARVSVELNERDLEGESPAVEETAGLRAGRMTLHCNGRELAFAIDRGRATSTRDGSRRILENRMHHLLLRLFCREFPRPFILSAERFGISLFYKELDFTKSQLVDLLQQMGRDDDRDSRTPFLLIDKNTSKYAQPIKDNIDYTRNIHDMQKKETKCSCKGQALQLVRAYVANGHKLAPATVDEFGIDMSVFDDTIDDINRVSRALAAEVQSRHNGVETIVGRSVAAKELAD